MRNRGLQLLCLPYIVAGIWTFCGGQEEYQQQQERDWTHMEPGELALALDETDKDVARYKSEAADWSSQYQELIFRHEKLVSENNLAQWELERAGRARVLNALERVLMHRFLAPVDAWIENPYVAREPFPRAQEPARWYALVIEPENKASDDKLWIKFYVDPEEAGTQKGFDNEANDGVMRYYITRKRNGLLDALEHHFVMCMQDPIAVKTMVDGTAHLYRLVSKDSDVDKLRKEDRIY